MSRMFFFGFGYTASVLARRLRAEGWEMAGTTRDQDKVKSMWDQGVEPHIWDGEAPMEAPLRVMSGVTHFLHSIPPASGGDKVMVHHRRLLAKIAPELEWGGYISSTGIYGNTKGEWCAEDYAPNPSIPRGKRRLRVESNFAKFAKKNNVPLHIFRASAIYGPGRSVIAQVASGKATILRKPGHFISRIHVQDLADVIYASIQKPNPGAIYNVADDYPCGVDEPVEFAASLLGVEGLKDVDVEEDMENLPKRFRATFAENRRIKNDLIKSELGVELTYPTFREGYQAIYDRRVEIQAARAAARDATPPAE